ATDERGLTAADTRDRGHAEVVERHALALLEAGGHRHDANLARGERLGPGRTGFLLGLGVDRALLPERVEGLVDLLGVGAIEEGRRAIGIHDVAATGPDDRPPREHVAATAVAAEGGAEGAGGRDLLDGPGGVGELLEIRRRLLGIKAG